PNATMAPVCFEAITSTPDSQNQATGDATNGMTSLAVKSPAGETYEVWRDSKCQVAGPGGPGTKMLTPRGRGGGASRATGSLTTSAPGGMVMEGLPPKVRVRSDPATIAAPLPCRAMWAAPIVRALAPKVDRRTRTSRPLMLVCTICRRVWLLKPV